MQETPWTPTSGHWRTFGPPPLSPLDQSILQSFVADGYQGATTRMLAAAAGLSVAGLYHHYPSKHAMLERLMTLSMEELYNRSVVAIADAPDSVVARLRALVECLALFHAHRGELAFLSSSELRSLEPAAREAQLAARRRQAALFDAVVQEGVSAGVFRPEAPRDISRAITTMCTGIPIWFRSDGPAAPETISALYADLAERMLRVAA